MKNTAVFILFVLFAVSAIAQTPQSTPRNSKKPISTKNLAGEKEEFEKALALTDTAERIAALQKFTEDFPKSKENIRVLELVTSARAARADEKFRAGEKQAGIELFKLAVREAPQPVSDKLYTEIILQIPNSLFFRGERAAASEVAKLVEEKADGNAKQLLALATFYLGLENVTDAKHLADKAILLEPNLPAAYQTLGVAHRLDFQFEESVAAYTKALELDPNSTVSKRSLAEMKRAAGKPAEAVTLYREILEKDATDAAAQTGLILALFDAENKIEAEAELAKSLEANPNNLFLLTGAAYWYAAREQGARAIELAEKAVAVEPRYTWARIALARGLMQQKRPFDAEKALLAARQYGDFPTLDYELATARFQAGFYREAAEVLQRKFSVKDNLITTKLGGRVAHDAKSFTELLASERRASIFQTLAADNSETVDRLKTLLDFTQKTETATDEIAALAADEFIKGADKMKLHRQLFAANQLLQKRKALPKVLELTKAAVGEVNAGLDVPNAAAAVLADELYQSRQLSIARNELVIVPEVPRLTLSNILRGRIEDIAGWALFQGNKPAEAVTRLKRAISVLPEKSAWWRGSMWRLGVAQEAAGNSKDALEAYVKSYTNGDADIIKYGVIESVYQKVNGNTDGLEAVIGAKPASMTSSLVVQNITQKTAPTTAPVQPSPEINTETSPTPTVPETTPPTAETKSSPEVLIQETLPKIESAPTPEIKPEAVPINETKTETKRSETVNERNSETKPKSIFEPIIISVPKTEPVKKLSAEKKTEETPLENKSADIKQKTPNESVESRPRVVISEGNQEAAPCRMILSEDTIFISNNGGTSSVPVRLEGEGKTNDIKAISGSPADVEVALEPGTSNQATKISFIVKSISRKTGIFTILFESACGKKEIFVEVR